MEYLSGKGGYKSLTDKYQLSTTTLLRDWLKAYQAKGDEGLQRSRKTRKKKNLD